MATQALAYLFRSRAFAGEDGGPKGTAAVQPTPSHAMTVPERMVDTGVHVLGSVKVVPVTPVESGAEATPPVAVKKGGRVAV
jgi:hypothetical protein